ncbi:hypothetical protein OH77DRAFT_1573834 [Trametes cingulata]|nr:hypothetical protein OH77DRAFT_1573834 [Trametes cingulata]
MRYCNLCSRSFASENAYNVHNQRYHQYPKPPPLPSVYRHHRQLTARPCDRHGNFLPPGTLPPPRDDPQSFWPFPHRPAFTYAQIHYERLHTSEGGLDGLLRALAAAKALETGDPEAQALFDSADDLLNHIDALPFGEQSWTSFRLRYSGPVDANSPSWKRHEYVVHTRNALQVAKNIAGSADFLHTWDYTPFEEYVGEGCRRFSNLMSAQWAYRKANVIAEDPSTHGAMFTSVVLGADKTTCSVATGHQSFHPLYMSLGNVHNEMRRAHRDSVVPLAFLPIPTCAREQDNDEEFRIFRKQLYHAALTQILSPLRPAMTVPHVMRCPDGHFRRAIFELGPFIADYPEQVYLSGIVQGWCPRCRALPHELERAGRPRFRAHTECAMDNLTAAQLWDVFGIIGDVTPFTSHFPRADIHELLTPDLLHQLIKGTFKDHLVSWVEQYIYIKSANAREAKRTMDEIDRRLAAAPSFPGLRRFPEGRNFSQWTGNDSKALMKVYLSAITGIVPDEMVQCFAAFLDFCYFARRSSHDTITLDAMEDALRYFHKLRAVFVRTGVRPDGFGLPRQHALVHYVECIKLFGSPNGLCSSITESKHIEVVKQPWRDSNKNDPLKQIIMRNTRLAKLRAAQVEFGRCGMLQGDVHTAAVREAGGEVEDDQAELENTFLSLSDMALRIAQPNLGTLLNAYLQREIYPGVQVGPGFPVEELPHVSSRMKIGRFFSASAVFFAPSELCGPGGMHREIIRSNPSWLSKAPRYDTVLVRVDPGAQGVRTGMRVARVRAFLSFTFEDDLHCCALVHWFSFNDVVPDAITGMWVVKPENMDDVHSTSIISISSIVRACHLMPVFGRTSLPVDFKFSDTLDAFNAYYINSYADYHSHETIL